MSDRGIKKWAPYKSLIEQETSLNKLNEEKAKKEKPLISQDKAEEINEILTNYHGQELSITYYRNGKIIDIISTIEKIDPINKKIILPERKTIYFKEFVNIEII